MRKKINTKNKKELFTVAHAQLYWTVRSVSIQSIQQYSGMKYTLLWLRQHCSASRSGRERYCTV